MALLKKNATILNIIHNRFILHDTEVVICVLLHNVVLLKRVDGLNHYKGRSPSNGKLSDFSFHIDSQKSAHRKFRK